MEYTKDELAIVDRYADLLERWHDGHCVSMSKSAWDDLYPIAHKHFSYSGSFNCRYCVLQVLGFCYKVLIYEAEG